MVSAMAGEAALVSMSTTAHAPHPSRSPAGPGARCAEGPFDFARPGCEDAPQDTLPGPVAGFVHRDG